MEKSKTEQEEQKTVSSLKISSEAEMVLLVQESWAIRRSIKSLDMALLIWDINQYLFKLNDSEKTTIEIEEISSKFNELCEKYSIDLADLIY